MEGHLNVKQQPSSRLEHLSNPWLALSFPGWFAPKDGTVLCVRGLWGNAARWPKFRPKSSKGAEEKKLARRIHGRNLAECYQKWQKRGPRKLSNVLYFTVMINTQRQRQYSIFITNCGFSWILQWCFSEIGRTLPKLGRTFLWTDRKTIWRPGNPVSSMAPLPMWCTSMIFSSMIFSSMKYTSTALYFYTEHTQVPSQLFNKRFRDKMCI
jgi:hypothetical protein